MEQTKKTSLLARLSHSKVWRTTFVVAVIAVVLLCNILFSVLCENLYWYVDMTKNKVTQISDAVPLLSDATAAYQERTGKEVEFRAIFCLPRDRAIKTGGGDYVVRCVEDFCDEVKNFSVLYYDVATNPALAAPYRATAISAITSQNVILEALEKESGERIGFRVYTYKSFYAFGTGGELYAFNGEYRIASTMLGLIGEKPLAVFVDGHNEKVTSEVGGDGLAALIRESGFDVRAIHLANEELPAETQVVVINNPTTDYGTTELRRIEKYVNNGGNIILFMDPIANDLYNLELLAAQYGVKFQKTDYVQDASIAQENDNYFLSAIYDTTMRKDEENSTMVDAPGAQLTAELRAMESRPKAMFKNACAISRLNEEIMYPSGGNSRDVSDIFVTSKASFVEGGASENLTDKAFSLMTWGIETKIHNDNFIGTTTYSYQLVSGCPAYTAYEYLQSNAYANNDVIKQALNNIRIRAEEASISFRRIDKENLSIAEDDTAPKTIWLICNITAIVAAVVCGVVVHRRRKYR